MRVRESLGEFGRVRESLGEFEKVLDSFRKVWETSMGVGIVWGSPREF